MLLTYVGKFGIIMRMEDIRENYYQICALLNDLGPLNPRLDTVRGIVDKPDFQYKKELGGDIVLKQFLCSSYWLAQEVFNDNYLYKTPKHALTVTQTSHLKMVDIGVELLNKGFPVKYNPEDYARQGPDKLAPYVKTFVEQCQKKHALVHQKAQQKNTTRV